MANHVLQADIASSKTPAHALITPCASESAWDRALANFREVEAVHDELWDRYEQATEAAADATPDRVARYFDDYRLGVSMSREDVELHLRYYNLRHSEAQIDEAQTADEFMAYQRQFQEADERFQTKDLRQAAEAHNPAYHAARDALMEVPAPNIAALLVKIEIVAVSLNDDHAEAMLADARRLLSGEA